MEISFDELVYALFELANSTRTKRITIEITDEEKTKVLTFTNKKTKGIEVVKVMKTKTLIDFVEFHLDDATIIFKPKTK